MNLNPFTDLSDLSNFFSDLKINEPGSQDLVSTKDLVGLENVAWVLKQWYFTEVKPFLLIIGPTGCGKTSLIKLFCKEQGILLLDIKANDQKTKKDINKDIISFSEYSSTSFFQKKTDKPKKLILIDEYQNGPNDLFNIIDITNYSELKTLPPFVIISSDPKGSKLSDLKKICEVYYIPEIPISQIITWVQKEYPNIIKEDLIKLIKKCKSDKRLLINILQFNKGDVNSFIKNFYKDFDNNVYDFTTGLLTDQVSLKKIFKVYESDGFSITSLIQENYLDFNQDIHAIADAAESISFGETVFSDTYDSGKKFLPELHCISAICIPSYHSKIYKKCSLRTSCINNRYNIYLNNKKNIDKINFSKNIISLDIYDILFIKKFLNQALVKSKMLSKNQELYLKNILNTFPENKIEKLELIYKHFIEFKDLTCNKEPKTKNFTIKFKEKLNKLNEH